MTRISAITKDQVQESAEKLKDNLVPVTTLNVRKDLGGGSYTTITRFLEEWREAKSHLTSKNDIEMPENAGKAMLAASREIWKIATATARMELVEVKETYAKKVNELEILYNEARNEIENLEKQISLSEDARSHLENKVAEIDSALIKSEIMQNEHLRKFEIEKSRNFELELKINEKDKIVNHLEQSLIDSKRCEEELKISIQTSRYEHRITLESLENIKDIVRLLEKKKSDLTAENLNLQKNLKQIEEKLIVAVVIEKETRKSLEQEIQRGREVIESIKILQNKKQLRRSKI